MESQNERRSIIKITQILFQKNYIDVPTNSTAIKEKQQESVLGESMSRVKTI